MSVRASTSGSVTRMRATSSATLPLPTTTARAPDRSGVASSKLRVRVVPAHEVDGGDAARQVLAGNVQRAIGLRPDGIDDGVVALGEFGGLHVLADHDVAEEPEARVFGGLFELLADRLDLRVVGRDAGAHQPPRGRQHLQHVDGDIDVLGRVGRLQQRCRGEEPRRSGTDDGDVVWAHTRPSVRAGPRRG